MVKDESIRDEKLLYKEVDKTTYEIAVKLSENASESLEDILIRMITGSANICRGEDPHG